MPTEAPRAAFLDFDSYGPGDLDTRGLEVAVPGIVCHGATTPAELADRLAGLELVLVNKVRLDRAAIHGAARLRYIGLAATGSDNVDVAAARERGVAVTNIRNYGTPSVVQHVFGLLLAVTLHLPAWRERLARGAWQQSPQFCLLDPPTRELAGKTFGIVGLGHLGRAVAAVARAFGMAVLATGRPGIPPRPEPGVQVAALHELLQESDVVSLHCPLTPQTANLINRDSLKLFRPGAVLLNTARGGLVDAAALAEALRSGRIGGAGIDVLPVEPPVDGSPLLDPTLPNLVVTPHIAWAARESRQRALDEVVANLRAFLAGKERHRLDR